MKNRTCSWSSAVAALAALVLVSGGLEAAPAPEKAAYLGVMVAPVDETLRDQLKLTRGVGLSVEKVVADSPAEKAGVKVHDILEKLNDQVLFNPQQLAGLVRSLATGDKATLTLIRQGARQPCEVTLGETELAEPAVPLIGSGPEAAWTPRGDLLFERRLAPGLGWVEESKERAEPSAFLGVELAPVPSALATQVGIEGEAGALVNLVVEDSPAAKAGLKPHDVIVELDGKPVGTPSELSGAIAKRSKGDKVALGVIRAGKRSLVEAVLDEKSPADPARMRKLRQEYRVVPRVRVLHGEAGAGDVVVHLDSEGEPDGGRSERRVIVHATEPRRPGEPHVAPPPGAKSSTTSVEHKVMVMTTDEGLTTTVTDENGKRTVRVKDGQGKVIFDGPIDSPADREKLPPEVREGLDKAEKNVELNVRPGRKEVIRELRFTPAPGGPDVI